MPHLFAECLLLPFPSVPSIPSLPTQAEDVRVKTHVETKVQPVIDQQQEAQDVKVVDDGKVVRTLCFLCATLARCVPQSAQACTFCLQALMRPHCNAPIVQLSFTASVHDCCTLRMYCFTHGWCCSHHMRAVVMSSTHVLHLVRASVLASCGLNTSSFLRQLNIVISAPLAGAAATTCLCLMLIQLPLP